MVPPKRPALAAETVRALAARHTDRVPVLLGVRGYYRRSMGDPERNDRGIYDDAVFLVTPHIVWRFNANTDPSVNRAGIATLRPGVHMYRKGKHGISKPGGGYPALRPATEGERLPVDRDGQQNPAPGVAINIHRGSRNSTSSEGCQTIHPDQWDEFIREVYAEMDRANVRTIPYVLIENDGSVA